MKRPTKTRRAALCSLTAAGSLALLWTACLAPSGRIGLTAAAGVFSMAAVMEGGRRAGLLSWGASTVLALILLLVVLLWAVSFNQLMLSAVHPALADSRGVRVFWQETVFSIAIAVVVTLSMTWVGLLVINSLLVLPAAAARNAARNMGQYHLFSVLGAVGAGIAGLMTSYYVGGSAGAAVTLYLAVWFAITFFIGKK